MRRLAALLLLAACAGEADDRPATLAYIQEAILVPHCATASCHRGDLAAAGLSFEDRDPAELREELIDRTQISPGSRAGSPLLNWLRGTEGVPTRMPPDQPLSAADIELIARWIEADAPL
jgi:hypothetical protein